MAKNDKRPIDIVRDSAGSFTIGSEEDQSKITGFVSFGEDTLIVVKETGLYEIKLADQIDPERTNITLPNSTQAVLSHGSSSVLVARTLLTANLLFKNAHHYNGIDCTRVLLLAFEATKDICALSDLASALEAEQQAAIASLQAAAEKTKGRNLQIPTTRNLAARVENFFQTSDHAHKSLFELTTLFFGDSYKKRWFETFEIYVREKFGEDDPFHKFIVSALPLLRFVRYARDAVEHPNADQNLTIKDFEISPAGKIMVPTLELVHDKAPLDRTPMTEVMRGLIDELSLAFENMLAHLADRHVRPFSGFQIGVFEFEPKNLGEQHVRYSLGVQSPNGPIRFG